MAARRIDAAEFRKISGMKWFCTMDPMLPLYALLRVTHVGTAIVLVGGTVFIRYVLLPAAEAVLANDMHARLRERMLATWKIFVHAGIALLLASGGLNYARGIAAGTHKGDALYHALLGTKILIALVIFFIASALVGKSARFEPIRRNSRRWLAVNIALATLVIAISGFLRVRGP